MSRGIVLLPPGGHRPKDHRVGNGNDADDQGPERLPSTCSDIVGEGVSTQQVVATRDQMSTIYLIFFFLLKVKISAANGSYVMVLQAFSENGSLLASVGQEDNHSLAVHDWEKGSLYHTGPSDTRAVRITLPLPLSTGKSSPP